MARLPILALTAAAAIALAAPAAAQVQPSEDVPVLVSADNVSYDREAGVVTATGNVEISQGNRILLADKVTYNQNTGVVMASGNVSLTEPTGEIIFADNVELTDDMREGVVLNFRMLFPDQTKVAANSAVRTDGNRTQMTRAVFSPCKLCEDDPTAPPVWQIKARKVTHDQEAHDIIYRDATMEMFGVPVAYTPYFSHPDPTVDRRTGLLAPSFGADSQLGQIARTPVFFELGPDKDLTLTPIIATEERPALAAEYRQRVVDGQFNVSGSFTRVERRNSRGDRTGDEQNRGHIFSEGKFDIDRTWRGGWDVGWTSDDTYLRRYDFNFTDRVVRRNDVISSTAWIEGFRGRNYANVSGYHFQGLRQEDDYDTSPIIAPFATYSLVGEPTKDDGRWSADLTLMNLTRIDGTNSRRVSLDAGWEAPYITDGGHIFTLSGHALMSAYWVNQATNPAMPRGQQFSGVTGRVFPQAKAEWRYPLVRELGNVRQIVEPKVALIVGPNTDENFHIPNEDSRDFEFDDTNLYAMNRYPGIDRVDGGQRIAYGVNMGFFGDQGGATEFFIGQAAQLSEANHIGAGSGVEDHLTDIVGRVSINPIDVLTLNYRYRLNKDTFTPERSELSSVLHYGPATVAANYFFFDDNQINSEFGEREEIYGTVGLRLTDYWTVRGRTRHDLSPDGGILNWGVGVRYEDECFTFVADFSRNFTRDRDLSAGNRVFFQVIFKHLGQVQTAGG